MTAVNMDHQALAAVRVPERSGSREQAREMLTVLPEALSGQEVRLDCEGVFVATPSFIDEMVKIILVERDASKLTLVAAPDRTEHFARRAAEARGVSDRLAAASE